MTSSSRKDIRMETRTFRLVPVQCGSAIDVLDKNRNEQTPSAKIVLKSNIDGAESSSSNPSRHHRISFNKVDSHKAIRVHADRDDIDGVDVRDDEVSPSIIRRYCTREYQGNRNLPTLQQPISETEKRIAQLRNAGLSISSKGLPPIRSPRMEAKSFQSPQCKNENREAPPSAPKLTFDPIFTGFKGLKFDKSSALQALLEKDSRNHQRSIGTPPPRPRRGRLSSLSRTKKMLPYSQTSKVSKDDALDPIIAARPSYKGMRVSQKEYPDPEAFGWTFVGSCEDHQVEFFEKDCIATTATTSRSRSEEGLVVLEFHYTTGTVKATLEHPLWGESLLAFCLGGSKVGGLAPKIYRKILMDPVGCRNVTKATRGGTRLSSDSVILHGD